MCFNVLGLAADLLNISFSGKWKQMKGKNEKNNMKEEQQDEKTGAVDQIKKKYGFSHSGVSWHIH